MPEELPLISIIIPSYNRSDMLMRAINSVLNQSYSNQEIIVIDDASTDDTEKKIRAINSPKIRYQKNKVNLGSQAARNAGIKTAKGQFLCFLDSDNELLPHKLELQYEKFRYSPDKVGVVSSDCYVVDDTNNTTSEWHFELHGNIYRDLLRNNSLIDFSAALIKRVCFEKTGLLDEKVRSYQEWDTFLTISKEFDFEYVPQKLAVYHLHSRDMISKDRVKTAEGYTYIVEKNKLAILHTCGRRTMGYHYIESARRFWRGSFYRKALIQYLKSATYNPLQILFPFYNVIIRIPARFIGAIWYKVLAKRRNIGHVNYRV